MPDERYLWDRSGPPDPEIESWERRLREYGRRRTSSPRFSAPGKRRLALLVAAALFVGVVGAWIARTKAGGFWSVERVAGSPSLSARRLAGGGRVRVGEALETDATSRARLTMRGLAAIDVAPGSRLRLVASRWNDERLYLDRGEIRAAVSAPPRLFSVETSAATAVDLGCDYTLSIGGDGISRITVTRGWVELGAGDRQAIVPAGFDCAATIGRGPGTPRVQDAPRELAAALDRFDAGDNAALSGILSSARPRDGLSLWHLLRRADPSDRIRVYERLAALVPPPPGVTRDGVLALDRGMLDRWRFEMGTPLVPRELSFPKALWARLTR